MPSGRVPEPFWDKVKIGEENDCWPWERNMNPQGYGTLRIQGKMKRAHRVAYELSRGPIPDGMVVCHTCDNPSCVNPHHLFLGSQRDNVQDMANKGRHPAAKLGELQVVAIRKLYASGERNQSDLANMFGVTKQQISLIINRKNWTRIP
jgi:hypothetical protein